MANKNLYPICRVFDVLLTQTSSIIICLDDAGNILEFNHKAEEIYGLRTINVIGENLIKLCKELHIEPPYSNINKILVNKTIKGEINQIKINNIWKVIEWEITLFQEAGQNYLCLHGVDITPFKIAEQNERNLNNYLENIINHLPHFIFWKDKNSVFLGCNQKFADSVGLKSPAEIKNKTDYDLPWESAQSEAYIKDDQEVMRTKLPKLEFEETQTQLDGTQKTVLVSKVPILAEENEVIGLLGIYTDITARKQAEQRLIQAKKEAEAANEAKTFFIRNMEHDIRTPFSGIYGLGSILAERETDQVKKEMLIDITNCAKQLLDYCNEVLDFSQIEAGSLPILMKKFDVKKLIGDIFTIENPPVKLKGLTFNVTYDKKLPDIIIGDEYRLKRILMNIVGNAIKFTAMGEISLHVEIVKLKRREIILQFICQDTGIGIPSDKVDLIFEKFEKINSSNKGKYKGQGLGLRIVKQFIDELDGEIEIESELNKGTTFICNIPFELPLVNTIYRAKTA